MTGLVTLVVLGFTIGDGSWGHVQSVPHPVAGGFLLALVPVMFSYAGWNAATYVAEEIRDPGAIPAARAGRRHRRRRRALSRAQLLYVYSLPVSELAGLRGSVMDVIAERLFGHFAGNLLAVLTAVSIAASVSAMIIAGPRVYFAMARDGVFFRRAAIGPPALSDARRRHRRAERVELVCWS